MTTHLLSHFLGTLVNTSALFFSDTTNDAFILIPVQEFPLVCLIDVLSAIRQLLSNELYDFVQ